MPAARKRPHISSLVIEKFMTEGPKVLFDPKYTSTISLLLWSFEIVINLFVITRVPYTEIDWKAYMQEVGGFLNGTYDYTQLKGDTGPLVYPAGFVYVYSLLFYLTSHGQNIRFAQYIFLVFYLINFMLVARIYQKTMKCPPFVLVFMSLTSYRVHSLFVLRLFNDPLAMLVFYISLNCFIDKKWYLGSFFFSFAVSIKMNVLLFAPGLLVVYLVENGILQTLRNLLICAGLQVALAIPFLATNPQGYLIRSFDLGRQFFHKWTVNWRFLSVEMFADRRFHALLLAAHLTVLILFAAIRWRRNISSLFQLINPKTRWNCGVLSIQPDQLVTVLFTSNFIGMCFSRSLHYQFYIWYYHTIPHLLWSTKYSTPVRLLIFGVIELCWNTYPSTNISSLALHASHALLLIGLWRNNGCVLEPATIEEKPSKDD
uniref:dolichyl-P-Man:Man5GlcNAc2-PP-dolichol alpha-1,3-mannosyltransferase n=1 Tax=Phallusia mammillata TaxID=59560 RepID=A0A6F9D6S8_9ASCI|nr:dol-P-Man:Man(5)GlcNAc(2)-PP-Dol alpha-1,3-mannosyltransferase-like [Phallusia mammillata]